MTTLLSIYHVWERDGSVSVTVAFDEAHARELVVGESSTRRVVRCWRENRTVVYKATPGGMFVKSTFTVAPTTMPGVVRRGRGSIFPDTCHLEALGLAKHETLISMRTGGFELDTHGGPHRPQML